MPSGKNRNFELSGSDMALLVAALGVVPVWRFEVAAAKALVSKKARRGSEILGDRLSAEWRALLAKAGLWDDPSGQWTRALIHERAEQHIDISLTVDEATLAMLALQAILSEFSDHWGEFCLVGTGAIDWYGLTPSDLARLRARIESGA